MLLIWLLCFCLCVTLILSYVQVYEQELYIEEQSRKLSELLTELGDVKKQRQQAEFDLDARAEALGLYKPAYEDMIVVHVRGS